MRAHEQFVGHREDGSGIGVRIERAAQREFYRLAGGHAHHLRFGQFDPPLGVGLLESTQAHGADALPLIAEHADDALVATIEQIRGGIVRHVLVVDCDG